MTEPGRTVRVSGLPTDMEEDRLTDRLLIHFLRIRNGGGEIDSVSVVKATPASALITFEDGGVAQRVIQLGRHILEVDGKKYRLTVTEHRESLHPDKVIIRLSATVDCTQLPGGARVLTSLHERHPDVHMRFTDEQLCTLSGSYSTVQSALAAVMTRSRSPQLTDSGQPAPSGFTAKSAKRHTRAEQRDNIHSDPPSAEHNSSSRGDLTPSAPGREEAARTDAAALQVSEPRTTSEEDFSLMMDADMFQYLQKHCQKEYQHILKKYGVEVVEMTNQDLTTLFLRVARSGGEGGGEHERLMSSRRAISKLHQENESKICRSQLLKTILSPRGGLQRALDDLTFRFPKLLLKEDDEHVHIIGSSSDVSEARRRLLLDLSASRGKKDDVAGLLRFPSYEPTPLNAAGEERSPLGMPVVERTNRGTEEDEKRAEGSKRIKLAARFKDAGLPALGNPPLDYSFRGHSSPRRKPHSGPVLGFDVLSGTEGSSREKLSRANAQNTGDDVLFKSGGALPPSSSSQNETSLNSNPVETRPVSSPAASGSTVRRASSFSGTPQPKAPVVGRKSKDDSNTSPVRPRGESSSFGAQSESGVYSGEIRVAAVLWKHMKDAYGARVDDLTSDVFMKESRLETGELAVTLTGASSSRVNASQQGLQKLIESVNGDFSVQELRYSDLGVVDSADETLLACCAEVRSRFRKVTFLSMKNSLFLVGPELLCSQVADTLREVFSCDSAEMLDQRSTKVGHERTNHRGDLKQPELPNGTGNPSWMRKDPVMREKVKTTSTVRNRQKTEAVDYVAARYDTREVNYANGSTTAHTDDDVPKESRSGREDSGCVCVCGQRGSVRTSCGVTLCSSCQDEIHASCRVCDEETAKPPGIQGTMSTCQLQLSLTGHRGATIKITYRIPDGIQAEGHPRPGEPFQGGVFEAYLPDCATARKLLPRLRTAFQRGLTFTVAGGGAEAKAAWDCVPHKTSMLGGKSGGGYPDSSYLTRLSQVLDSHGIQ